MRRVLTVSVALAMWLLLAPAGVLTPTAASAAPATPMLTSPVEGAYFTSATPTFTGTGGTSGDPIAVNVYAGLTTSGTPVQVLSTQVGNGTWSVAPTTALPDGTYTAQAVETDTASATQTPSQAANFVISTAPPALTLSLPSTHVSTPAPTFSGTAPTAAGDGTTVYVTVYAGRSTNATPLAQFSGALQADGSFMVNVSPGLGNGTYTAVASQPVGADADNFSPALSFTVGASAPKLTLTDPIVHGAEAQTSVLFAGAAGDNYGDDPTVNVTLYSGSTTGGRKLGTKIVRSASGHWHIAWPTRLTLGTYTLVVTQSNIIGQTTTITRTFTVSPPGVLKGTPAISPTGLVSVRVACPSSAPSCTGDILVETEAVTIPVAGGPAGDLRLLFRHYSVKGGTVTTLTNRLGSAQLNALKRAGPEKLKVTTVYALGAKLAEISTSTVAVRVG